MDTPNGSKKKFSLDFSSLADSGLSRSEKYKVLVGEEWQRQQLAENDEFLGVNRFKEELDRREREQREREPFIGQHQHVHVPITTRGIGEVSSIEASFSLTNNKNLIHKTIARYIHGLDHLNHMLTTNDCIRRGCRIDQTLHGVLNSIAPIIIGNCLIRPLVNQQILNPFLVTKDNFVETINLLSDSQFDPDKRKEFRKFNPLPFAKWSDSNVLLNGLEYLTVFYHPSRWLNRSQLLPMSWDSRRVFPYVSRIIDDNGTYEFAALVNSMYAKVAMTRGDGIWRDCQTVRYIQDDVKSSVFRLMNERYDKVFDGIGLVDGPGQAVMRCKFYLINEGRDAFENVLDPADYVAIAT